ncbi:MAG: nickel-dependent lactate racemase [Spirochaetia bacterium]|nr:nickel-dependent lactate racemase [Spirochaetia bacterium]MCF7945310.1 nickel-dependent lactate racemase [Spirochaetia bacterium]MCF7946593.1 nickel-dependent lactate racemase [Spirochaetia bacterium]
MNGVLKILQNIPIPRMYKVRYHIESSKLENISLTLKSELWSSNVLNRLKMGQKIAVTVGSRGISNQTFVVKTLVDEIKKTGADPFIIPAMGSHAGANAESQKFMLEGLGFTEEYMGVPIRSSMEVVQVGTTKSGMPVFIDKMAYEADGVVLVNRIKAHTAFHGEVESGLVKMAVIGLGKQKGAEICHELGFATMSERIAEIAHISLKEAPVLFGVALLENAEHETSEIHVIAQEKIEEKEPVLLKKAKDLMARVPFKALEVLVLDQIGKDISGSGLDPNVVGRYHTGYGSGGPNVVRMCVLDITDVSHGNGNGLGIVDFTTQRAYNKFNLAETYPNSLTSNVPVSVKIPMVLPNDKTAIQASIKTCLLWDKTQARLVRIKDTLSLNEFEISENLLREVKKNPQLEIIEGPYELHFDENGNLL